MTGVVSRVELEAVVGRIRHLREELRRAPEHGRSRRRLDRRVRELETAFERLLAEWLPREDEREAWRAHLRHAGPEPTGPVPARPLVYRGRSPAGSLVEVHERPGGDYDVRVDGALVEIAAAAREFAGRDAPHTFDLHGQTFHEVFTAPAEALAALAEFVAERSPQPPWRHGRELLADGLVDGSFALTARGRRALAAVAARSVPAGR